MPTGSVLFDVTDALDAPIETPLTVELTPTSSSAGGAAAAATFPRVSDTQFVVTRIAAIGGLGTRYAARLRSRRFKTYAAFQIVIEGTTTPATQRPIRLIVDPGRVADITAPAFGDLQASLRTFLANAAMQTGDKAHADEDRELLGRSGAALYEALGPLRRAALLNIFTKARDASAAKCWSLFLHPLVIRQDRCFLAVDQTTAAVLRADQRFNPAGSHLHKPLAGYTIVESFKSDDRYANLQVTVMTRAIDGACAADVDIDEASGIAHWAEVFRNLGSRRTNPYLIRDLLLLSAVERGGLDPGYRFVFDE